MWASSQCSVCAWSKAGVMQHKIPGHGLSLYHLSLTTDGITILDQLWVGREGEVVVWSLSDTAVGPSVSRVLVKGLALAMAWTGCHMWIGTSNSSLHIYDPATTTEVQVKCMSSRVRQVSDVCYDAINMRIWATFSDTMMNIHIYDCKSFNLVKKIEVGTRDLRVMELINNLVWIGLNHGEIRLWDTKDMTEQQLHGGFASDAVSGILHLPESSAHPAQVWTCSFDHSIYIWQLNQHNK
eukprot:TRINITY_DN19536_c0_g2_i1.p1 TRINITY_DN19536_c0_g2~~TRINITY_DN19536_c0_g2_i1.p1  ORF type:complete len:239 (+),score=47.53 TRINITY_DN19536_c0_g2_i1:151-867(+)